MPSHAAALHKSRQRAPEELISWDRLRQLLRYEPETGRFVWLVYRSRSARPGMEAGRWHRAKPHCVGARPYWCRWVTVDRKTYSASRLAWFYMTGEWPAATIDHRDGDSTNNRWLNLRTATYSQNAWNARRSISNSTGFKGVSFERRRRKYRAQIKVFLKIIHIGYFNTAEEAHDAYCVAAEKYFGEYARTA